MKRKTYAQRGKSNKRKDKQRPAKKPGWRKSKRTGRWYFENRRNRSDKSKKKRV